MDDQNIFEQAQKLLETATSIIVVLPPDPSTDIISSGLSLYLSLKQAGKKIQIGCGSEVHVSEKIKGSQEISDTIGDQNLVISFDYLEENLEKVDYDVLPGGKFYLMIKPKAGAPVPDVSNVKYSYSGAQADLVITFGINSLEELGKIYAEEKKFLDSVKILSLNNSARPASFTPHTLHKPLGSFAELVTHLLEKITIAPTRDASANLLNTIYEETKSLTSAKMTADTFSAISFLMRNGARLPNQQAYVPRFSQPSFFEAPASPHATPVQDEDNIPLPTEGDSFGSADEQTPEQIPQDWTKPKIFRATDS